MYGFNEDKSKANLADQFVKYNYSTQIYLQAEQLGNIPISDIGTLYPADQYIPISITKIDVGGANIASYNFRKLSNSNFFNMTIRNPFMTATRFDIEIELVFMKI